MSPSIQSEYYKTILTTSNNPFTFALNRKCTPIFEDEINPQRNVRVDLVKLDSVQRKLIPFLHHVVYAKVTDLI